MTPVAIRLVDYLADTSKPSREYLALGVPHCWLIDAERQLAWQIDGDGEPTQASDALWTAGWTVRLQTLFAPR